MQDLLNKKWGAISILLLTFFTFFPLLPFLNNGLPITHDGVDHVARIANFYQGLVDGNLIPRWGANLNWGYGHPVLMFLYPLSSYAASLFHFLGFSFEDSLKIVFIAAYIASGFTMFFWARKQLDNYAGLIVSILYLLAPYRFIDLYVRGAIGEHVAFVFPPLIMFFLYKLFYESNSKKIIYFNFLGISFSLALLILAHNAISIMFLPLILVYAIYLAINSGKKRMFSVVILGLVFGFILSSFFLIPAFVEGKYTLRDIVTGDEYKTRFVEPFRLIYSAWNFGITGQFSVGLGATYILGLLLFPLAFFKIKNKNKSLTRLLLIFLSFFLLSIFLMIYQSNFLYKIFTTFKKFQFPWRFLSLSVFTISVIAASPLYLVKNIKTKKYVVLIVSFALLIQSFNYIKAKGYFSNPENFYNGIYKSTTDTGESSPIWSVRFMEDEPIAHLQVIEGDALLKETERKSTGHIYYVKVSSDKARFKDNTVYFPGWHVYVDGKDVDIQFQDPLQRGLITFNVPKGEHDIEVIFQDTKLRSLSNYLSLFSFIILILGIPFFVRKK